MNSGEKAKVKEAIEKGLDRAEANWGEVGHLLEAQVVKSMEAYAMDRADSNIPGHPEVTVDKPQVDDFIALVVDMRKSTMRLNTYLKGAKVNSFQRVYYETSALLPAMAVTSEFEQGSVTEYLGDGGLVLFGVDQDDVTTSVQKAYRVAKHCIGDMRALINDAIAARYNLPPLDLGVGLAKSKAMVTLVGAPGNYQPKAIGTCVWEATKLSAGVNSVFVSKPFQAAWPTSENGLMRFKPLNWGHVKGYKMASEKD